MIKAIIFDLDGVLIDATNWHYEALNQALNTFGYEIKQDDHLRIYNGLPTREKLKILSQNNGLPLELHNIICELKKQNTERIIMENCKPNYTKQMMLACLKKQDYRLACCSNSQKFSVENMLKQAGLISYFDIIIGNDESYAPKPSPEIYLAAFQKFGFSPTECLIIEDAPHGIEAAKSSGAQVIAVRGFDDVNISLFENLNLLTKTQELNQEKLKIDKLPNFTKGWFLGNFDPSLLKTEQFEVGVKKYKEGDKDSQHLHKIATEYTIIVSGKFRMNNQELYPDDIVTIFPNQTVIFECLESGTTLVIKTPSLIGDKYEC